MCVPTFTGFSTGRFLCGCPSRCTARHALDYLEVSIEDVAASSARETTNPDCLHLGSLHLIHKRTQPPYLPYLTCVTENMPQHKLRSRCRSLLSSSCPIAYCMLWMETVPVKGLSVRDYCISPSLLHVDGRTLKKAEQFRSSS